MNKFQWDSNHFHSRKCILNCRLPKWGVIHDDVIKCKHFPRYWPFVREMNFSHKGQWRGALMFSLICTRINGWVNNGEAGDLRRYRVHCDITVMSSRGEWINRWTQVMHCNRANDDSGTWRGRYSKNALWKIAVQGRDHDRVLVPLLTCWGRVTQMCVNNLTTFGPDNGLSHGRRQAIIWTNAEILSIVPLGTNLSEISISEIQTFSLKKMGLKVSSGKCMMTSSSGTISRVTGPLCGNSPVIGEFPSQRAVTRGFDVFFDLRLNE